MTREKELWQKLFLSLNEEQKKLCKLAPILLECSKKDADKVGALVWTHFINNDEWNGTFRYTGRIIAEILNKRFAVQEWNYLDFYCSNLRWKSIEEMFRDWKRMERKYGRRVCIACEVEELEKEQKKLSERIQKEIEEAEKKNLC